jgi:sigma 54 modulation/S30EA-like ribosomal protein
MQDPLRIAFRNMAAPFGADDLVRDGAAELARFVGPMVACNVVIEKRHRPLQRGNLFDVHIELILSDHRVVAHRRAPDDHAHEGLDVAIADAFGAAQRQLQGLALA